MISWKHFLGLKVWWFRKLSNRRMRCHSMDSFISPTWKCQSWSRHNEIWFELWTITSTLMTSSKCVRSRLLLITTETHAGVLYWVNKHQHLNGQGKTQTRGLCVHFWSLEPQGKWNWHPCIITCSLSWGCFGSAGKRPCWEQIQPQKPH